MYGHRLGTKSRSTARSPACCRNTTNMPATSAVPKQGGQEFAGSSSEIFLRHPRALRRMICPSPARPSATARPTRRACPAPPTAAAPGAVRQQLCARASYGELALLRAHPPSSAPDAARVQVPRRVLRGRQGPCRGQKCSFAQA